MAFKKCSIAWMIFVMAVMVLLTLQVVAARELSETHTAKPSFYRGNFRELASVFGSSTRTSTGMFLSPPSDGFS
ncbi:hypothetical protein Q3G72_014142 [Acer saccharum]|nr:hypothetical protein Q3G72_014142 [Acer saccharum]